MPQVPSKRKLEDDSVLSVCKTGGKTTIPRHVRRALECVETILTHTRAYPVGFIGEGRWDHLAKWIPAEILNVGYGRDSEMYYYVHFLGKDKKDDDWLRAADEFRQIEDMMSIRDYLADGTLLPPKAMLQPSSPSCSTTEDSPMNGERLVAERGQLWSHFFSFSQLSKQTSSGGSAYSASSTSTDPHEFSPKTIRGIELRSGQRVKSWYRSPFEEIFWSVSEYLQVCESCLCYGFGAGHECVRSLAEFGALVYETGELAVFEVDGLMEVEFCVRVLLLSKLFLEDKRTSTDGDQSGQVSPFLFYVLAEKRADGKYGFVGYFSKYKVQKRDSPILSCIMVLPSSQRKGYGKILISMAYELTGREGRQGSAERPLSGPGYGAFLGWWTGRLRDVLANCYDGEVVSIAQLSELSGMTSEDVVETLRACGSLKQWGNNNEVKLRESGKRAKIKLTIDTFRALDSKCPKSHTALQFDPTLLCENTRTCPVLTCSATPTSTR